jgi:hypothetical protein
VTPSWFDGTLVKVRVDPHSLVPPSQQLVAAVLDAIASGEIRRATSDYASCLAANRTSMGGMRIQAPLTHSLRGPLLVAP